MMKKKLCGKMIEKQGLLKACPCLRKHGHTGAHTPDLTGLVNVFGYAKIIKRAPDYVNPVSGGHSTQWVVLHRDGWKKQTLANYLFNGRSAGISAPNFRGVGCTDKRGKPYPEYTTIQRHWIYIFNFKSLEHSVYKRMKFYDKWNPIKGGSIVDGCIWIRKNLGPKPGKDWQMHVIKSKKCPFGFFGPGGIIWRHKMDRHDQSAIDIICEWSNKKWIGFLKQENNRRKIIL
jgi:hypothetical protein